MARIKIELPEKFQFSVEIPIRITDLNYGGHVANDRILGILHEARVLFLASYALSELDFAGTSLIMGDVGIEFKKELHYGDKIIAFVGVGAIGKASFELYYKLERLVEGKWELAVTAKTGMVCYNYKASKITCVPSTFSDNFR